MNQGYTGRMLFVNLTTKQIEEEQLPDTIYRSFIGGAGLGARILYERMKPKIDPLGPENIIGFVPGLLTGTQVPMSSKYAVVTKSPLTGTWADSNAGGYFGPELKKAGYDAIFFSGTSPKPVYLIIYKHKIEIRDAAHLWGKDTVDTEKSLRHELGDRKVRVACIGPSGEAQSLMASVIDGRRAAARQGVGAVMGAKKLKAVAIRGNGRIEVADPERVNRLRKDWLKDLRDPKAPFLKTLSTCGTSDGISGLLLVGASPIKNWSLIGSEAFPDYSKLAADKVAKYHVRKYGCSGCPIVCGGIISVPEAPYKVVEGRRPEYETVCSFGPMCLNTDIELIAKANDICDRYGIDTISAGTTIAFAMECYENGIIGKEETGGIELTWGSPPAILALLEKIVKQEGFGNVLADGVQRAAERIGRGAEKYAIHIHGQEPGYHDPRLNAFRGLGYIASPRPGRHMVASPSVRLEGEGSLGPYPELKVPASGEDDGYERKGYIHAIANSYNQTFSDSGMCVFALTGGSDVRFPEFISAVTGWDFSAAEAVTIGKRIQTLRQSFNIRDGLSVKDFRLPDRIAKPPHTGPYAGRNIDFNKLRTSYYTEMGWDTETGCPTEACLNELGIKELVGT